MTILKFSLICLLGAGLLILLAFLIGTNLYPENALPYAYGAIGLAALSTIASYTIVANGLKIRVQMFTGYVMGGMMVKMIIGILSISIIALKVKEVTTHYVLTYFICYFIFTAFEVVTLMTNLRAEKSEGKREQNEKSAP